ncbi:MAG: hypothetical protein V1806_03015 [Pseudomonadota bacterium]
MRRTGTLIMALALVAGMAVYAWAFEGGYGMGWGGHMMNPGYHMSQGYGPGYGMGYGMGRGANYANASTTDDGWAMGPGYCWGQDQGTYQADPGAGADDEKELR